MARGAQFVFKGAAGVSQWVLLLSSVGGIMNKLLIVCMALSASVFAGCATIVSGSTQSISMSSVPSGATVTAEPGGAKATTPGSLILKRKDGPYKVTFALDGHDPYSVMLTVGTNGWVWGNLIIGGIIGLVIDTSTGASTKLSPDEVNVNLVKSGLIPQSSNDNMLYVFNEKQTLLGVLVLQ